MKTNSAVPGLIEVEDAVRAVLGSLLGPSRTGPDVEMFSGRLLSLRSVEGFRPSVRVIQVEPGTVITPLAGDRLKQQRITVQRVPSKAKARGVWGFALSTSDGLSEALRRHWLDCEDAWQELSDQSDAASAWVTASPERGALVLTESAHLVVYRACQVPGVRAAEATDPAAVGRAIHQIGANLLAVEPMGKPLALIRRIGATFRGGGAPVAPSWLRANERSFS